MAKKITSCKRLKSEIKSMDSDIVDLCHIHECIFVLLGRDSCSTEKTSALLTGAAVLINEAIKSHRSDRDEKRRIFREISAGQDKIFQ